MNTNAFYEIEKAIGYTFRNKNLLRTAFTHSSLANEKNIDSNERMEFLGDSILGFVIAEYLYDLATVSEGDMSVLRSNIVSREPLAKTIKKMGLDKFIETTPAHPVGEGMKENLYEAIVGAIYLDCYNLDRVVDFIMMSLKSVISSTVNKKEKKIVNYKTFLQEKVQGKNTVIKYKDHGKSGTAHEPIFEIAVFINGEIAGIGKAKTKKEAGQNAALEACKKKNLL